MSKLKSLIGTKKFYKTVIAIALPVMLQQGITSFVSILDNLMVGQLDTISFDAVAIVNQILFIINIALVGGLAGPGIYISQYLGANDEDGMRRSFRVKMLFALVILTIGILVYSIFGRQLIGSFFLNDPNATLKVEKGLEYLFYMIIGLIPLAIVQLYGTSLRETGHTRIPMVCGIIAILTNLVGNYILIFGHFGAPALGVTGAAIATVFARVVEATILVIISHAKKFPFCHKVFNGFAIGKKLLFTITKKGSFLLLNEVLWSLAMTVLVMAYTIRGEDGVVSAYTIASTVSNLFYIIFAAQAAAISIMVGNELGANRLKEAEEHSKQLLLFAVCVAIVYGMILATISFFVPSLYPEVTPEARSLATKFMLVVACFLPVFAYNTGCFFVLRAGGKTSLTFVFDSGFIWVLAVPIAFILTLFTSLPIVVVYLCVQALDLVKATLGTYILGKKTWLRNLTVVE